MFNLNIINLIMNLDRIQHRIWQISLTLMVMLITYATFGCDGTRFIFSSSKDLMSTPDDLGLDYE
ncbi:MAG: hypothetical protein KJP23_12100, partial [Deltaproteobacteria bacterium]|nr:hypothetical protein [Deltaproteobacteria bacterium]